MHSWRLFSFSIDRFHSLQFSSDLPQNQIVCLDWWPRKKNIGQHYFLKLNIILGLNLHTFLNNIVEGESTSSFSQVGLTHLGLSTRQSTQSNFTHFEINYNYLSTINVRSVVCWTSLKSLLLSLLILLRLILEKWLEDYWFSSIILVEWHNDTNPWKVGMVSCEK